MDEFYTLKMANLSLEQLNEWTKDHDNGKPPLYYMFMHFWLSHENEEGWTRLPSAIFGALTCVFASLLGMRFLGDRGWILGLLLALSPLHIWYSQEARMYTMMGLFCVLAFYFHTRFCQEGKGLDLVCFIITGVLTCYTHPYAFFFLAVTAVCALFHQPALKLKQLLTDGAAHLVIFGIFCLWIPRMIHSAVTSYQDPKGHNLAVFIYTVFNLFLGPSVGLSPDQLRVDRFHAFAENPGGALLIIIGLAVSVIISAIGFGILFRENRNAFVFALAGSVVLTVFPVIIAVLKPTITNNPRYAFLALFPLLLGLAAFFLKAWEKPLWTHRILGAVFAGFVALSLVDYYFVPEYERDDIRSAAHYLMGDNGKNVDFIFVCDPTDTETLGYYYHGPASIVGLNYPPSVSAPDEAATIKSALVGFKHPVLIYLRPDHGDARRQLPDLFESLYPLTDKQSWPGVTYYQFDASASSTPQR